MEWKWRHGIVYEIYVLLFKDFEVVDLEGWGRIPQSNLIAISKLSHDAKKSQRLEWGLMIRNTDLTFSNERAVVLLKD